VSDSGAIVLHSQWCDAFNKINRVAERNFAVALVIILSVIALRLAQSHRDK
jgi:uncharacterized membrane protein